MSAEGEVYFISDGEAIKIGWSGSALVRMRDLQVGHPRELKLLHTIPGTMGDEDRLHMQFDHLWVRGEWFRPGPDLMAFIEGRDYEQEVAQDILETKNALAKWARCQSQAIKNHCAAIDTALDAVIRKKPFWNPTGQIACRLACIERELANANAQKAA